MKLLKTILLATILSLGALECLAQPMPALGVGASGAVPTKDTLDYDLLEFEVGYQLWVVNKGTATFKSDLFIFARYNSTSFPFIMLYKAEQFLDPLAPGDSVLIDVPMESIIAAPYKGGDNVIVIWPAAGNPALAPTSDSTEAHVFIKNYPTGISSVDPGIIMDQRVKFGPNPVKDRLYLRYISNRMDVEHVRLYSLHGQMVFQRDQAVDSIELSEFRKGMYMLEIRYRDGTKGIARVMILE